MPIKLGSNEIKDRALRFSREWADETRERAEASSFWNAFFDVFGIDRRRLAQFEAPVKRRLGGNKTSTGFIDLFWKGTLIVEHKSAGKSLEKAFDQAIDYFPGITNQDDLPRFILVSDFQRFHLYDLIEQKEHQFALDKLHENIKLFGFMTGTQTVVYKEQDPANIIAAERMGKLHDQMRAVGYEGHALERYLVRLLFCLFAEDTSIFDRRQFQDYIEQQTREDGADLAAKLDELFYLLNIEEGKRLKNLDESLTAFPYVNGALFEERLPPAGFDRKMRDSLLEACGLDWSKISPAIFGALFQSIMDSKARRNLGAHYTSEKNILKLIHPLFLDQLNAELEACGSNRARLADFHSKIARLKFLDPACGCGNFLVITYRELRLLELKLLKKLYAKELESNQMQNVELLVQCDVDQFYGIEIEEFPAQIAQVALWLTDHQMNLVASEAFGLYFRRLPLKKSAKIVHGNALRMDWADVVEKSRLSFILGNPPFVGKKEQNEMQKADTASVFAGVKGAGVLDYVCAWYLKAAKLINGSKTTGAFVSTNSISQGEQPGILWPELWKESLKIHFAHRTFSWSNEAKGNAAVHCVIIGFGAIASAKPTLFDYDDVKGDAKAISAGNINPYLVNATDQVLLNRRTSICKSPEIAFGSMPNDDGNLLLSDLEMHALITQEPASKRWIRRFVSADEFLNKKLRWCLWLNQILPNELRSLPNVFARVANVKAYRLQSAREATKKLATFPQKFGEDRQPTIPYLLIPRHSSENRSFIPFETFDPSTVAADSCMTIAGATNIDFGVLQSTMHMAWVRAVCGRLKSDFRYSASIVYNNFPWPEANSGKINAAIETAAQTVMEARAKFSASSLADLYNPLTMPSELAKSHQNLDKAVDAAYGFKGKTDAERVAFLFVLYQKYTSLFAVGKPAKRAKQGRKKQSGEAKD